MVFNRGLVEQSGTPEQLQTAPETPFVMQFVSDTNALPTHHAVSVAKSHCLRVASSNCNCLSVAQSNCNLLSVA